MTRYEERVYMKIERFDKKSGVRLNSKDFTYQEEGKATVVPMNQQCRKQKADDKMLALLKDKLEAWNNTQQIGNKLGSMLIRILFIIMLLLFIITMLFIIIFNSRLPMIPLVSFALLALLGIMLCMVTLKKQKKANLQFIQNYNEAKELLYINPPEIYEYQVIEKQWYEAVEEETRYFLKFKYFTLRVDLTKYNATNTGDFVTLAILKTMNSNLLFIL